MENIIEMVETEPGHWETEDARDVRKRHEVLLMCGGLAALYLFIFWVLWLNGFK